MAQSVVYTDDLDGTGNAKTILFAFEGQEYEIDLAEKNAKRLGDFLQEFIEKARPVDRRPQFSVVRETSPRRRSGGSGRDDIAEIRAWAEAQGMDVAPRGRIKKEIIEAYDAAHS
jgi:hypothetical protein